MKRFVLDIRGSAPLWSAFFILILISFSVFIYTGAMIYSKYDLAQTELERSANISVDQDLINSNVRDLILDIPADDTIIQLENNLIQAGFVNKEDGIWLKSVDGKEIFSFNHLQVTISGDMLDVTTGFIMPLPWDVGIPPISIPMHIKSKVLYLG